MADTAPEVSAEHIRFCEEYCKDRNGTRSALAAGLATDRIRAANVASELLRKPYISALVKRIFREQARRLRTEVPDLVREWAILGKSDLTDYVVGEDGRVDVAPGVPRAALRAVKKVKVTRSERLSGDNRLVVDVKTEIELHSKDNALTKLYEHLHGVLPGEKGSGDGGMSIADAIRLRDDLARRDRDGVGTDVPGGVPVVPEGGAAVGSVPE